MPEKHVEWYRLVSRRERGGHHVRPYLRLELMVWSRNRDLFAEVNILNRVQQLDAFAHRTLKCLATGDEAGAAAALIDDRGAHRFRQIARAF